MYKYFLYNLHSSCTLTKILNLTNKITKIDLLLIILSTWKYENVFSTIIPLVYWTFIYTFFIQVKTKIIQK